MNCFQRWIGWALLALVAALPASAKELWLYARTDHFEIYSSASERQSRQLLGDLEEFRTGFRSMFSLAMTGETPVTVVLFGSRAGFENYEPLYKGKVKDLAGYCVGTGDRTYIALCTENWAAAYKTIFHEYVHHIVKETGFRPPLWLNEGLATLYQTADIQKDSITFGQPDGRYLTLLKHKKFMPLEQLVAVTTKSPEYNEGTQASLFYATSWCLTHYLICGQDKTNSLKLLRFLELTENEKSNVDASFQEAFGMNYQQMEKDLDMYFASGKFYFGKKAVAFPDLREKIAFTPVAEVAHAVTLQSLHWLVRRTRTTTATLASAERAAGSDSDRRFSVAVRELSAREPTAPEPYVLLATMAKADDTDVEAARLYWQKAAELGSKDPTAYLKLANGPMYTIMKSLSLDYRMPPLVADPIRANLDRAIALRPDYYEAWEMLAMLEALAEKQRLDVINQVQELQPKMKKSARTLLALAIIRWRLHDVGTCREIIEVLDTQTDDGYVAKIVKKLKLRLEKDEVKATADAVPAAATPAQ